METRAESLKIAGLVDDSLAIWDSCTSELPELGRTYSEREQEEREQFAAARIAEVDTAMRDLRRRKLAPQDAQRRITAAIVELTSCALDVRDPYVDWLLGDGFGAVSTGLARQARQMDSSVSMIDILQAARNAWTTAGLQAILGVPVQLTPSIFAYSMLYPYSDNFLDDPAIGREAKLRFSERFRQRLEGEEIRAQSRREEIIWDLVKMIEGQYARADFPQVYESLLAIHSAQEQSLRQLADSRSFDFVLPLTFTKGGTSVLADACLAAGSLSHQQASFAFRWGIVLQLGDDLQDVASDLHRGSRTLYTMRAGREPLDQITTRTFHFGRLALAQMESAGSGAPVLHQLLRKSSLLLIRSAAGAANLYTAEYLDRLEAYSPFRFEFLRRREDDLARRNREYALLFEELIRCRAIETRNPVRTFRKEIVLTRQ